MKTEVPEILFSMDKAKEVALFFFNKMNAHEVDPVVLAQLMYKAERESYQEYGYGLTMDKLIQGMSGPMLKHTQAWLTDECFNTLKEELIHSPKKSDDKLLTLSDAEVDLLSKNWVYFSQKDLKIWQKEVMGVPESKALPSASIYLEDVFYNVGFNSSETKQLVESILTSAHIEKIFKSV